MNVAIIENDTITNVAVFDSLPEDWPQELIPIADLPEGAWIGWQRNETGEWFDPNAPEPDPEPAPESEE